MEYRKWDAFRMEDASEERSRNIYEKLIVAHVANILRLVGSKGS
jgi:hypothetical protein